MDENQVRPRAGKQNSLNSFNEKGSSAGGTTTSVITLNLPFFGKAVSFVTPMFLKVRNRKGEWASQIHFMPKVFGVEGRTWLTVQDSNLFTAAFCALPLYYFRDDVSDKTVLTDKPVPDKGPPSLLSSMRSLALENIKGFKRGRAYNFWPIESSYYGEGLRVGPLNIWIQISDKLARVYKHAWMQRFVKRITKQVNVPTTDWVEACLDKKNPNGADAFFNIANDADDSSVALVLQYLDKRRAKADQASGPCDGTLNTFDNELIEEITQYRDIGRKFEYESALDVWKGRNSGAFLTWLKNEQIDTFEQAHLGVIPGGKNNVDIVVNANVLFSLSLLGRKESAGYKECCELLISAVEGKRWPEAGLYYPQLMMFPYALSRAIRDGGVDHLGLLAIRGKLMKDVLSYQIEPGFATKGRHPGAICFSGGADGSYDFSSALALSTLLNLGEGVAEASGILKEYRETVSGLLKYLLARASEEQGANKKGVQWQAGLFFSASFWDLAQWRSNSVTCGAVMEALLKYLLVYDKDNKRSLSTDTGALVIESYLYEKVESTSWLKFSQTESFI